MQRSARWLLCWSALAIGVGFLAIRSDAFRVDDGPSPGPEERAKLWNEYEEAIKKGLPKTAIEKLEPIIAGSIKDKAYAEAIKGIGKKIALEGNVQGNKPEEKIVRMKAEIQQAPDEMKPVMEAILANWYWHYFQQNRWRFVQRTRTDAAPSDDFTTWDLPRILAEIDKHFTTALAFEKELKATPIGDYADLLDKGNVPDSYRPTMYDFVAFNALDFYTATEQAGAKSQDAFEMPATSPIFESIEEFLAWKPESTDEDSPTLKAIHLYQRVIEFHADDADLSARLDADLHRLEFGYNRAFGDDKKPRYINALKRFEEQHPNHEISARAISNRANVVHGEGDWVEARAIAKMGLDRFPQSIGGNRCYNLIQQIEARESRAVTERVWNQPSPTIEVHYRNVTQVYFRVVRFDFDQFMGTNRWHPENMDQAQQRRLLDQDPLRSWSADLPATEDYQTRIETLTPPKDLAPGSYFLIASHRDDFSSTDNQISFTEFWVSDLALITRNHQNHGVVGGIVLNAIEGEPVSGAKVRAWHRDYRNNRFVSLGTTQTDANGMFRFASVQQNGIIFHVESEGQALSSTNILYSYRQSVPNRSERTVFFTDRSLYRPGQTIHFKGICLAIDPEQDDYATLANRSVSVVFRDVNGKEIATQAVRTNANGSFSGSFTAPRDRLMGRMSLNVDGPIAGSTGVTVEEYKRPKFQVSVSAPKEAPRLNEVVILEGKATAYTGASIDGAKVRWRVVREVRYPTWWYWRCWWMPPNQGESQEIAHGTALTERDGTFQVSFTAKPDPTVPEESEPTFRYVIHADVTDTAGETRSGQREVNVGYTALKATLSAADWQSTESPVEISVRTATLDDESQPAEGVITVHTLKQPKKVHRANLFDQVRHWSPSTNAEPKPDPANPNSWDEVEVAFESPFTTNKSGNVKVKAELPVGMYRASLKTSDRFGKEVTAIVPIRVIDPNAEKLTLKIPDLFEAPKWSLEPGEEFEAIWGSGYDTARAFVEIEHRGQVIDSYWTKSGRTQQRITRPIDERMRGGFTVRVTMVRENRAYMHSRRVDVPWTNKQLTVKWERFVSKLQPGYKETWTAVITGPDAKQAAAEMVAAMYDASLDAYLPHSWPSNFGVFRQDHSSLLSQFENTTKQFRPLIHTWTRDTRDGSLSYRQLPNEIIGNFYGYEFFRSRRGLGFEGGAPGSVMPAAAAEGGERAEALAREKDALADADGFAGRAGGAADDGLPEPDLDAVAARKNLDETAFFFPHLITDADGTVRFEFTMPEALTEWKFLGFAHDNDLRSGLLTDSAITSKDLMVQPNPPRFLRAGDTVEFTVKISNLSTAPQKGTARLTFADARTTEPVNDRVGNVQTDQRFDVPPGESRTLAWKVTIPDRIGFLTYKVVGASDTLSDGEEGYLPVLSRRVLVIESLPLPIRGPATRTFEFAKLLGSGASDSLEHKTLSVQMASNPSWYAIMALPYLMEYPYECSEQTFNRLYANAIARHIANSDPKIRRIFDLWRGTDALDSPLTKNQDLKDVMLEETPWFRQAMKESEARKNIGILFDQNRLNEETNRLVRKLAELQHPDGAWPWFPGGPANDFITLYIVTGFGRMRHLGVETDMGPALNALPRLDAWADRMYRDALKNNDPDKNQLSSTIALYLYGRSFFLKDRPIADEHKPAVEFWLNQARTHWLKLAIRQSQAHLALALKRFGDAESAVAIMRSINERSVNDDELGMFWRDTERSWWWYRAPIETQALMIEAFDEVMNDRTAVEDCKVWLLKQKQTQDWKTTKATADAVYALLLRGSDVLVSDALVEVTVGETFIQPEKVEAGTGFYEHRFTGEAIKPEYGTITVKKFDEGVAWGGIHWQYLEDVAKITPHDETPLKLTKQLYKKVFTKKGPVLEPVEGPVEVGDEVVVRVVLRTDRDMEYVHLKDHRGSGTEPVNVLSRYRFQDGLAYYESTRDTASHFFIDYLPKGTYVFEYSTRVQLRGQYQTGMARIECMYAPEFNSHSESLMLDVR